MMDLIEQVLVFWGMIGVECIFVVGCENCVYKVMYDGVVYVLCFKCLGYCDLVELILELIWMVEMVCVGILVFVLYKLCEGCLLEELDGYYVDLISWFGG